MRRVSEPPPPPGRRGTTRARRRSSPVLWILLGLGAVLAVPIVWWITAEVKTHKKIHDLATELEDLNRLQTTARHIADGPKGDETLLATDGRLDVYAYLERAKLPVEKKLDLCTSSRMEKAPTAAEIQARDYRNYPYRRFRGALPTGYEQVIFFLWDPEPDEGERLVATNQLASRRLPEERVQEFLRDHPGQE